MCDALCCAYTQVVVMLEYYFGAFQKKKLDLSVCSYETLVVIYSTMNTKG
jgi:hypothetical protein